MSIPFFKFKQSFGEFISYKTNKVGVTGIVLAGVGLYYNQIEYAAFTAAVLANIALITLRDTFHGMSK